jgi:Mg2+ and Co2+ transporter CorA
MPADEIDLFRNATEPIFLAQPNYVVLCNPPNICIVSTHGVYVLYMSESNEQFADVLRSHLFGTEVSNDLEHSIVRFMSLSSVHLRHSIAVDTVRRSMGQDPVAKLPQQEQGIVHAQKAVFEALTIFVENAMELVQEMDENTHAILERIRQSHSTVEQILRELKGNKLRIMTLQQLCTQLKHQFMELNEAQHDRQADAEKEMQAASSAAADEAHKLPATVLDTLKHIKYARTIDWMQSQLGTLVQNVTDEEEFAAIQLDRQRNNIQYATLVLTAVSISFSFMSMVSGMLGENLGVGTVFLVGTVRTYAIANSIAVLCSTSILAVTLMYCRRVCL